MMDNMKSVRKQKLQVYYHQSTGLHHTAVLTVYSLHHPHCLSTVCKYTHLLQAIDHSLGYSVTVCLYFSI